MTTHESKCIEWKRKGAVLVAGDVAELTSEQESKYWHRRTQALRQLQNRLRSSVQGAQQGAAPDARTSRR